jgi:hypothetical protein
LHQKEYNDSLDTSLFKMLNAAEPEEGNSIKFQFLKSESVDPIRVQALGEAPDFRSWPRTYIFRVAPCIDKSILQRPELVIREGKAYSYIPTHCQDRKL